MVAHLPQNRNLAAPEGRRDCPFFRGALVDPRRLDPAAARSLKSRGFNAVTLDLLKVQTESVERAVAAARTAGLQAYGWIQVGRDEQTAREHPEWMHSPQHANWLDGRRFTGRAVVWPWVCVNNRAVFEHELERVVRVAARTRGLKGLFLCDIQGPPNGCGCGNALCRSWDNSPGPKVAPSPYEYPTVFFSQVFTEAVRKRLPGQEVIAVLSSECENGLDVGPAKNPDAASGACRGIPCLHPCSLDYYPGLLRAMAGPAPIGLLALYKTLGRDRSDYGGEAAWVGATVTRLHQYAPGQRIFTVLEGWNASPAEQRAQIESASRAGAAGYVMALTPIDQSWKAVPAHTSGVSRSPHDH